MNFVLTLWLITYELLRYYFPIAIIFWTYFEGGRKLIVFGHHKVVLDSICDVLRTKISLSIWV